MVLGPKVLSPSVLSVFSPPLSGDCEMYRFFAVSGCCACLQCSSASGFMWLLGSVNTFIPSGKGQDLPNPTGKPQISKIFGDDKLCSFWFILPNLQNQGVLGAPFVIPIAKYVYQTAPSLSVAYASSFGIICLCWKAPRSKLPLCKLATLCNNCIFIPCRNDAKGLFSSWNKEVYAQRSSPHIQ